MNYTKPGRRAARGTAVLVTEPPRQRILRRPGRQAQQPVVIAAEPTVMYRPDWRERERERKRGRIRYRLRRQLMPWRMMAGLYAAAGLARLAVHLTGDAATVAEIAAVAVFVATIVGAVSFRDQIPAAWRRLALVCAVAGSSWLTWTTTVGITWTTTAALLAAGSALSGRWWRRHRIPNPTTEPIAQEVPSSIAVLWKDNVGLDSGGPCPGSYLTSRREIKRGRAVTEAYDVQLKPGRQSATSLLANLTLVASGLRLAAEDLVFDPHPSRDSSRAVMQIVKQSPIRESVPFTGPQYEYDQATGLGTIRLGPFADGADDAVYKLYSRNSMWGGVLIGGTGSGKSRLTESIALSAASADHTVVFYGDPQGGASSPALAKHADFVARGEAEILAMLRRLMVIGEWRTMENAAEGLSGFTPTVSRPGIVAIIDECHRVFLKGDGVDAEARKLAAHIAREFRKVGIVLLVASQYPGVETFGGDDALRSSLMAGGNTFVLRTSSKTSKSIIAGLQVDPSELPAIPGYAYVVAASGTGRTAPFRGFDLGDDDAVRAWMDSVTWRGLDDLAANAFGDLYTRRHLNAAYATERAKFAIEEMRAGRPVKPLKEPSLPAASDGEDAGTVVTFPAFPTDEPCQDGLKEAEARVVDAIRAGNRTPKAIQDATGYGETHVRNTLRDLVAAGRIAQAGKGRPYAPNDLIEAAS